MKKTNKRGLTILFFYYGYLLIVWGFFRLLFRLPEAIEEFWIKPLVWLLPLLGIWYSERKSLPFFKGDSIKAVFWGVGVGVIWLFVGMVVSLVRKGTIGLEVAGNADVLGAAVATSIVEELVFSGYIFQKILQETKDFKSSTMVTAVMFAMIHIPIGLFVYQYKPVSLLAFLVVVGLVEMGSSFVMFRSKNVIGPMIAHFMWAVAMTVIG